MFVGLCYPTWIGRTAGKKISKGSEANVGSSLLRADSPFCAQPLEHNKPFDPVQTFFLDTYPSSQRCLSTQTLLHKDLIKSKTLLRKDNFAHRPCCRQNPFTQRPQTQKSVQGTDPLMHRPAPCTEKSFTQRSSSLFLHPLQCAS